MNDGRYDLTPLVIDAVFAFGGTPDGTFNSAGFSLAVKSRFGLEHCPDGRWAARVLRGLDCVEPLPGGCHWRYLGDLSPLVGRDGKYCRRRYDLQVAWDATEPAPDDAEYPEELLEIDPRPT